MRTSRSLQRCWGLVVASRHASSNPVPSLSQISRRCAFSSEDTHHVIWARLLSQTAPASETIAEAGLSPAVRYILDTHKITDTSAIPASGPKNRLLKGDILKYLEDVKAGRAQPSPQATTSKTPSPPPPSTPKASSASRAKTTPQTTPPKASYTDTPTSEQAREEARILAQSKREVPHVYLTVDCKLPSALLRQEVSVVQALTVKAVASAAQQLPEVLSTWRDGQVQPGVSGINISHRSFVRGSGTHQVIVAADRMSVRDIATSLQNPMGGNGSPSSAVAAPISIHHAIGSDVRESTGILRPYETISLYISSHSDNSHLMSFTLTADSRILTTEQCAQWLSLVKTAFLDQTLFLL